MIYIANARIPTERAHGIQIMKMIEAFAHSGLETELLIPKRLNHIKADPFEYYRVKRTFIITKLPCLDLTTLIRGRFVFFIQTVTFLISVKIYLLFKKYDILYAREQLVGLFFNNFVLELHTLPQKTSQIHKYLLEKSKSLVVLTSFIKEKLITEGVPSEKIVVAPDGVDIEQFTGSETKEYNREKLGLPIDRKIILYAGQLYDWKGVSTLAEAARNISDVLVVFVGGNQRHVEDFSMPYRGVSNIMIIGQKPHFEIPLFLSCADVLVLPNSSKEDISRLYTSPLKLFEYMASNRPIIASDLPSIREILDDSMSYFFEADNALDLKKAIEYTLTHQDESNKKTQKSLAKVKDYTWNKRAEKILGSLNNK